MTMETERQRALFEWLGTQRRVMCYGPELGDVSDDKERAYIARWLDKEIGDFLDWQRTRKVEKIVLERTDYVNNHQPAWSMP